MELTTDTKIILGVLVATAIIIVGGAWIVGNKQPAQEEAVVAETENLLREENSIMAGPADAKVTVVEFADFQCPACASFYPVMKQAKEKYSDQSVSFVFRHYPLPQHEHAQLAAEAAEAAHAQGKFWEYHDILFENQPEFEKDQLIEYAEQIGLNMEEFNTALDSRTYRDVVLADLADGRAIGVPGTPSIYINGVKYTGSFSLSAFEVAINEALEQ